MLFSKSILRQLLLFNGLVALTSSAVVPRARPSRGFVARRETLPEGVPEDCTFLDKPTTEGDDCQALADAWGISVEDFIAWNPSVGDDCSGIQVGESYCVERNWGAPIETSTITDADPTPTKPSNGIETPDPVQLGIVSNCNKFYYVKKGENCRDIAAENGITEDDFGKWNPKVGATCTGLWADTYACVSIIGHQSTTAKPSPTNGIETPSPIQENMIKRCNKFHLVKTTTTCLSIESYYRLPLATFYAWNPSVDINYQYYYQDYHSYKRYCNPFANSEEYGQEL
ncbi:hypothetical protein G7Z17_g5037 [Cylindrodendrum hubeiense]|uniref:LysM domain-containing protein n=1 Tax=Cylindrodendrum hubeiense TaxID=595255 RepID=A0A9P5H7T3_9HYPO|nr:hypothetical protein G7Z17_g5037 [Cylindrodendrum hubeiense]